MERRPNSYLGEPGKEQNNTNDQYPKGPRRDLGLKHYLLNSGSRVVLKKKGKNEGEGVEHPLYYYKIVPDGEFL